MPSYKWTIDARELEKRFIKGYKAWDRYYKNCEIDRQKYYEGFNVGREKVMFKEELKDLETHHKKHLVQINERLVDLLPTLLHYMDEFVSLNKKDGEIREKLETLHEKLGREPQDKSGDCDSCDGGCDE